MGPNGFLESIQGKPLADIDEWQTQMQTKAMELGMIHLYSSLSAEDQALTGVRSIENLNRSVELLIESSNNKTVAVIPEGPYVVPYVESPGLVKR